MPGVASLPILAKNLAILPTSSFFLSHTQRKYLNLEANSLPNAPHCSSLTFHGLSGGSVLQPGAGGFCQLLRASLKHPSTAKVAFFPWWHLLCPPCPTLEPRQGCSPAGQRKHPLAGNFVFLSSSRNKSPPKNKRKSNKSHMCFQAPAKTVIKSLLFLEKQGVCQPWEEEAVNPRRGSFL